MNLTEIKEAAEKQPELKKEILSSFKSDFIKGVEAEGMVVRTKDQDQTFLDNHVKTVVDAKVAEKVQPMVDSEFSKMMSKIDDQIKEITGIDKVAGEKTTAFAKRAIEAKQKNGDPVTTEKVKELENLLKSTKEDYEKKLTDAETKSFSQSIQFQVDADLDKRSFAVPAHLKTDEEKQGFINQQKALLKQGFLSGVTPKKDNEGNIVFHDGDKPLLNTKDGKPKSASDIIAEKYSPWFIPEGHKVTGTGGGQGGGTGGFKSSDDVHKYLAAQGVDAKSPAYMEQFEKLTTEHKISV